MLAMMGGGPDDMAGHSHAGHSHAGHSHAGHSHAGHDHDQAGLEHDA
jgi:hypothetical protein